MLLRGTEAGSRLDLALGLGDEHGCGIIFREQYDELTEIDRSQVDGSS